MTYEQAWALVAGRSFPEAVDDARAAGESFPQWVDTQWWSLVRGSVEPGASELLQARNTYAERMVLDMERAQLERNAEDALNEARWVLTLAYARRASHGD